MYYREEVNPPDATIDSLELITRHSQAYHLCTADKGCDETTNLTETATEQRKRLSVHPQSSFVQKCYFSFNTDERII